MEVLQRSTISFRRQGSSGIVFDDLLISELNKSDGNEQQQQPKPLSESSDQVKPISGSDEKDKLKPIIASGGGIERSRSNGGGAQRHHRTTGRVSPAIDPPSPRISSCGCCSAFGKNPPVNPKKRPPKRRSR